MKLFTNILLTVFLVACFSQSHASGTSLRALPDTFTVLQANIDTFNVTNADSIPVGDSACISIVGSAPGFSVLNCSSLIFQPDSTFTGRDTLIYALCDTFGTCDTTMVVVYVGPNPALLPVVSFMQDTTFANDIYNYLYPNSSLFNCSGPTPNCVIYQLVNTSANFDSVLWEVNSLIPGPCPDTFFSTSDTIEVNLNNWCFPINLVFRLTAYNRYGSLTICDTSCQITICEGINEVPLANIHIYPDPAYSTLTIDMRQNTAAISADYAAINIYDNLGQKVRSIPRHDSSRMAELPVSALPDGIYVSTIVDAKGTEMMLGKFTVMK